MSVAAVRGPGFIRPDGKEKVTGTGRYTADLTFTGMAYARFRYADHPHARIRRIDTTKARAVPGVVAVVTQADLPDVRFGGFVQDRTLFAKDVVRFEGEIVAGVAALTEEIAAEAARLIEVEYEPLPVVTDFVAAMEPGRPADPSGLGVVRAGREHRRRRQHDGLPHDREGRRRRRRWPRPTSWSRDGTSPTRRRACRSSPGPCVAEWQGDEVTIWSSTQVPYAARAGVAQTLQIPEANVRIVVPLLGGGFGAKCDLHFEAQVAALARAARRPVKLVFSRARRSSSRSRSAARAS